MHGADLKRRISNTHDRAHQQLLAQKRQRCQTLAQLSFPEKMRIVEKLRDASKRMAQTARRQGLR